MWWNGPRWLLLESSSWPEPPNLPVKAVCEEELCHATTTARPKQPIIAFHRSSNFTRLKRVTAWILRFVNKARPLTCKVKGAITYPHLTVFELVTAENYWISVIQHEYFLNKIELLEANRTLLTNSNLLQFRLFLDKAKLLHVGGRLENFKLSYSITSHNSPWESSYHQTYSIRAPASNSRWAYTVDLLPKSMISHNWSLQDSQIHHSAMHNLQTSVTETS